MKLKSQNKYRRLRKPFIFILSIILTLSVCSLEGFKKPYKASTEIPNYNTTYGTYSLARTMLYSNSLVEQDLFTYSFNGTYNGRFRIYYTSTAYNHINSMNFINCYVESKTGTYIQIAFKNQSEIAIIFSNDSAYPMDISSIGDYNMTKISDGVSSQLETLQTIFYAVQTAINGINTNTSGINTNVADIEQLIRNYFTTSSGTTINIGDIILQFNEFNAQLQLQLGVLNDLKTALNNIDDKIDTISWNNITFKGVTTDFSTFNASYTQQTLNNSTYVAFNQTNEFARGHANVRLFKLTIPAYASNDNYHVYFNSNANTKYEVNILFAQKTRGTLNIYFTLEGSSAWGNLYPSILWNGATIYTSPTPTLQYIDNNDIEYWSLYYDLYSLNYYKNALTYQNTVTNKLDDVINAINDINISISDDTVQNTETIIQEYNENYTTYHNVENNYINNYESIDSTLDKTNFDNPINITGAKGVTDSIINKLFNVSYFKVIFYVILLGFIVIKLVR